MSRTNEINGPLTQGGADAARMAQAAIPKWPRVGERFQDAYHEKDRCTAERLQEHSGDLDHW